MTAKLIASLTAIVFAFPAFAAGDAANGEKEFGKCKACHMIVSDSGTEIVKGSRTGPNLYGVIGRPAGSADFRYSPSLAAAGAKGLVWDAESLDAYSKDPTAFLREYLGDSKARSTMTFKLRSGGLDVAAYLEQVAATQ